MKRIVLLALLVTAHAAHADDTVEVAAAPAIEARPTAGLDPDVTTRFDVADAITARTRDPAELAHALDRVLVLYRSDDPFSRAQREPAKPRALAALTRIGEGARTSGSLELAARALDARWTLAGTPRDPLLADVLATWSAREADASPARALYLARRARRADPSNTRAAELDDDLSRNRRAWPGRLMVIAGALAFGAGLYAQHESHDHLATGMYVASPILCASGLLFELSGVPRHAPVSPVELPAL